MFDTCVILAGGFGSRLQPLTDNCPKPLVNIHNSPFLLYLTEYLASYGVSNFIILTGYLGNRFDIITDYYKRTRGISIRLFHTPENYSTIQRLQACASIIEGDVLICYGDVYAEPDITHLYNHYQNLQFKSLSVSAISRHARNKVNKSGRDNYKDIGFICINSRYLRNLLQDAPPGKFENLIFATQDHTVYFDRWSYASLTDLTSYNDFKRQLSEPVTLILDRDGVLNALPPKGQYINNISQIRIISKTMSALQLESNNIKRIIIATNQPWIGESKKNAFAHDEIKRYFIESLQQITTDVIYLHCPHQFDARCFCRKPKSGMIETLLESINWLRRKTLVIGDSYADSQLAQSLGDVGFVAVESDSSGLQHALLKKAIEPRLCVDHRYYRLRGLPHGRFDS